MTHLKSYCGREDYPLLRPCGQSRIPQKAKHTFCCSSVYAGSLGLPKCRDVQGTAYSLAPLVKAVMYSPTQKKPTAILTRPEILVCYNQKRYWDAYKDTSYLLCCLFHADQHFSTIRNLSMWPVLCATQISNFLDFCKCFF